MQCERIFWLPNCPNSSDTRFERSGGVDKVASMVEKSQLGTIFLCLLRLPACFGAALEQTAARRPTAGTARWNTALWSVCASLSTMDSWWCSGDLFTQTHQPKVPETLAPWQFCNLVSLTEFASVDRTPTQVQFVHKRGTHN